MTNPSLTSSAVPPQSHKRPDPSTSHKSPKRVKVSEPKKTTKESIGKFNTLFPPLSKSKSKYYIILSSTPSASEADKSSTPTNIGVSDTQKELEVPSHRDSNTQGGNHFDVSLASGNLETYLSFSKDVSYAPSLTLSTASFDAPLTAREKHNRVQALIEQK